MLPVGHEHMTPVEIALFCARFKLASIHGIHICLFAANGEKLIDYSIDNLVEIDLIDKANLWLLGQDRKED